MVTAVDGRIDCAMTEQLPGVQEYYSTLDSLAAPSRVSGRVTAQLEMASPGIFEPQDAALGHESFSRNADADGYEIVIDTRGTLLWDELDASERVSRDYIAYLDGLHISWIACGKADRPVAAHALIAHAVEKQHAKVGLRAAGLRQHDAEHVLVAARLLNDRRAEVIVVLAHVLLFFLHGAAAQLRHTVDDDPRGLAAGVHFDGFQFSHLSVPP